MTTLCALSIGDRNTNKRSAQYGGSVSANHPIRRSWSQCSELLPRLCSSGSRAWIAIVSALRCTVGAVLIHKSN
jgi:hypothetical protein